MRQGPPVQAVATSSRLTRYRLPHCLGAITHEVPLATARRGVAIAANPAACYSVSVACHQLDVGLFSACVRVTHKT